MESDARQIARLLIDDEIFTLALEQAFLEGEKVKAHAALAAAPNTEK